VRGCELDLLAAAARCCITAHAFDSKYIQNFHNVHMMFDPGGFMACPMYEAASKSNGGGGSLGYIRVLCMYFAILLLHLTFTNLHYCGAV
jgi:hypothetical protein